MPFDIVKTSPKEFFLDMLFPNKCPFCGDVIRWDQYLCDICFDEAGWEDIYGDGICRKCGFYICICNDVNIYYDRCYGGGIYEDRLIKNGVLKMKYKGSDNAAKVFAHRICGKMREEGIGDFDGIVPVPMHFLKKRNRGFNQAEVFAEALSEELNIPVRTDILKKKYSREQQHSRRREERRLSVEREYSVKTTEQLPLKGKHILLCDDIMTTGSTLNRCARLLKDVGAKEVTITVCAKTV